MSAYENVVGGKLKLKGKALDVKAAGIKKKKKTKNNNFDQTSKVTDNELSAGGSTDLSTETNQEEVVDTSKPTGKNATHWDAYLTPAERRYVEQREKN